MANTVRLQRRLRGYTRSWWRLDVLVGLLAGLALAGRAFGSGVLLNVDLVVGDTIPIPPGQFGIGAELPRRVPFFTLLAPWSWLVPGPTVVALVLTASVTGAVAGTARLATHVANTALLGRPGSFSENGAGSDGVGTVLGLAYGLSPFVLTRAAVGHLPLVVATAFLPWAILSVSQRRWPAPLWWATLFALTGSSGAVVGLLPLVVFTVWGEGSRLVRAGRALALVAAQAVWLLPGLVAVGAGIPLPTTSWESFATYASGVEDWLQLVSGGGFFIVFQDVARMSGWSAALGLVLLVCAVLGSTVGRRWSRDFGWGPLLFSAVAGGLLVVAPIVPGLSGLWSFAMSWGPLTILREPQKFWPVFALGLLCATAVGLRAIERKFVVRGWLVVVAGVVVLAAWPGLWGADGRLVRSEPPEGWSAVEEALSGEDGALVVLPWKRYRPTALSGDRNVITPAPWLLTSFDGEVLTSADPGLSPGALERDATFEDAVADLEAEVRGARPVAAALGDLGVRWVLVDGSSDVDFYRRIGSEPGATVVVDRDEFLLVDLGSSAEWNSSSPSTVPVLVIMLATGTSLVIGLMSRWAMSLQN